MRTGRFLIAYGPLPLFGIMAGLSAQLATAFPQLLLPVPAWPFPARLGRPTDPWPRYLAIADALGAGPWAALALQGAPYLLTITLLWWCFRNSPTRLAGPASCLVLLGTLPMYDAVLEALALILLAALAWAYLPRVLHAGARYLGLRPIRRERR